MVGRKPNRLIREKSPYLLQHAYNPVDWYPWGREAFEKAEKENKPIFLSVGYSSCHWCHVMERESFEDPAIANKMNRVFVSVKVDREERPDIDAVYMKFCQTMTGRAGWPLTVLMTPNGKPFYAGTYFPKETRSGVIGMSELVSRVHELWEKHGEVVMDSAEEMMRQVSQTQPPPGDVPGEETLSRAFDELQDSFDEDYGGFGGRPKFAMPHNLCFLLRWWKRTGDEDALRMVTTTLDSMRFGGISDQIGFGFHRYSTDRQWLVPHFEKMLCDQALLAMAYLEAYQATHRQEYARTTREILEYVGRDMCSPGGGFYSAEDADSEGEEGKYYLWTLTEMRDALGAEDAEFAARVFHIREEADAGSESHGFPRGANVPHLLRPLGDLAQEMGIDGAELSERIQDIVRRLRGARRMRVRPNRDDKIMTDWNGLMIAALARAAQVLGEEIYLESALKAAGFVLEKMRRPDGRLLHRYRDGESSVQANLDDYAFLVWGLIELHEASFDWRYLEEASRLSDELVRHFWDDGSGGFYMTPDDGDVLPLRLKQAYDGAVPSGNSVAMLNLMRLGRLLSRPELEEKATVLLKAFSSKIRSSPSAHSQMLIALDFMVGPSYEIVLTGIPGSADSRAMIETVRARFLPNKVVMFKPSSEQLLAPPRVQQVLRCHEALGDKATAYVCVNYSCRSPVIDPFELGRMLDVMGSPL